MRKHTISETVKWLLLPFTFQLLLILAALSLAFILIKCFVVVIADEIDKSLDKKRVGSMLPKGFVDWL